MAADGAVSGFRCGRGSIESDHAGVYGGYHQTGADRRQYFRTDCLCRHQDAAVCGRRSGSCCADESVFCQHLHILFRYAAQKDVCQSAGFLHGRDRSLFHGQSDHPFYQRYLSGTGGRHHGIAASGDGAHHGRDGDHEDLPQEGGMDHFYRCSGGIASGVSRNLHGRRYPYVQKDPGTDRRPEPGYQREFKRSFCGTCL